MKCDSSPPTYHVLQNCGLYIFMVLILCYHQIDNHSITISYTFVIIIFIFMQSPLYYTKRGLAHEAWIDLIISSKIPL